MSLPDLDALLDQLRSDVASGEKTAVEASLERIETALAGLNPAVRATTYAQVQVELGRPLQAAEVISDLIEVLGEDARLCYQLGCYKKLGGALEDAEKAFLRAVARDPDLIEGWIRLGGVLDDQGKPEAALDCYRPVLAASPEDPQVWRNLGNSLAALGRFSEAADAYDTALGLEPGDKVIAFLRSSAYQAQGNVKRANELLPASLREEFGHVVEFAAEGWVCRFHATEASEPSMLAAAKRLVAAVAAGKRPPQTGGGGIVVVERDGVRLVCDADQVRSKLPNRFFDATVAVSAARTG